MFVFIIIVMNFLTIAQVLFQCGKKQEEASPTSNEILDRQKSRSQSVEIASSTEPNKDGFQPAGIQKRQIPSTISVYHQAAAEMAFPASKKCFNHDDTWRMLALYTDYIRAVNPEDFRKFKLLDSGMAVLHDVNFLIRYDLKDIPSDLAALSIIYFLVAYHKIQVNYKSTDGCQWFEAINRHAKLDDLEKLREMIHRELFGSNNSITRWNNLMPLV